LFFFSSRRRHTRCLSDWSSDVCSSDLDTAIGLGASYSLNHSGWGGVPMPSTISDVSEFDALVGAMGGPGRGVVEISSGATPVETMEQIAARHGRRIFMSTATALYNEQYPERALGMFDACAAAQ